MRPPVQTKTPGNRRILAGLAVLAVSGGLFVLPLYAALALCTMPCCHHDEGAEGSAISGAIAACETECAIRSGDATPATVAAVAPENGIPKTAPLGVAAVSLPAAPATPMAFERDVDPSPRGIGASLQVLNSVFRI